MSIRDDLPLAVGMLALVPAIWATACPPLAVVRATTDPGGHVSAGIGQAAALSGLLVGAVVTMTGSPAVAILGSAVIIAYAGLYLHAREVDPRA